ncbi:hypothetical protein ACIBKY_07480 [Nonomuraea sp. NPDC050394]|uniref:hypothetical protein n=1 Tax=Nonomuraea sp. NPDC050394 TaxID=3364363 RepID=UPI003790341D
MKKAAVLGMTIAFSGLLGPSLPATAAETSLATETVASASEAGIAKTQRWSISLSPARERLSQKFYKANSSYISANLQYKRYNHGFGVRAVKCGGGDLGPWVKITKYKINYVLTYGVVRKGTCFQLKAGRSWASSVWGYVNH